MSVKSGGEWISSIDLENLAVGHPGVLEAAVIGIRHPKWDRRPLLIVQLKPDSKDEGPDILHFMEGKIMKMMDARRCRRRRCDSTYRDRQNQEDRIARTVRELQASRHLNTAGPT